MADTRILVVEDEQPIRDLIAFGLRRAGCDVALAGHSQEALASIGDRRPDLVLVDWMLPDMSGLELVRALRRDATTRDIPIVMLTARGEEADKVTGLESGADDYVTKPFSARELVARIQAVLRRRGAGTGEDEVVRAGGLELDRTRGAARLEGRELALTTAELALLDLLVRNRGRILSRDRILEATRGLDWEAYDRSVDVLVSRLRQKLGDDARRPRLIRTVRGAGYSFIGGGE